MAFIKTAISAAVGDKSMGKPAPNKPDDVKKIQALLKKALGSSAPGQIQGDTEESCSPVSPVSPVVNALP